MWRETTVTGKAYSDIVQKHRALRFTLTTGRGGRWETSDEGETEMTMTDVVVTNPSEMRELTIAELGQAGGGLYPPGPTVVSSGLYPPGPTVVGAGVFHVAGIIIHE
jgi:hypothetical protein